MYELIRSFLLWLGIASLAVFYGTLGFFTTLLSVPFDRRRRFAHIWPYLWSRSVVALNWRVEVDASRLPRNRHFVIVANHTSLADIIVCLHLWHNFKFLAKQSVFNVPFLGWFMYPAGYIPLKRGKRHSVEKAMEKSRGWLAKRVSVLFYPEGTRSPDGSVREFKPGAFRLAIETQTEVLPLVLLNSSEMLPKDSFFFSHVQGAMRVVVCDPIPTKGLTLHDVNDLAERTRQVIIQRKAELEGVVPAGAEKSGDAARAAG